jgi:ATP-dependent exoDNAse (exonuclease V) beta subunit
MRNHISYSELKTWNECAYKHKLVYVDDVKKFLGNEYTAFGTAIHDVCEKAVLKEIKTSKDDLKNCFNEKFLEEIKDLIGKKVDLNKNLIKQMKTQAEDLVEHIIPELNNYFSDYEVFSAEEELYEVIDNHSKKYKGYIDLVLKTKDGKYHIIDWKTCSWGWDSRRKNDSMTTYQLTFYKHFFAKKHNIDPRKIETHFALLKRTAKKNKVEFFRVTSGNKKIENSLKLLNKAVYNIENNNFVKNKLSCTSGYGCEFYNTEFCSR